MLLGETPPNPLLGTLRPPQAPAVMIKFSGTKGFYYILRLLIMLLKQEVLRLLWRSILILAYICQ